MDKQKLLRYARDFGGEARANHRANVITKADRDDLVTEAGLSQWGAIFQKIYDEN